MSVNENPNISIVTILNNSSDFLPLVQYHWDTLKYPKDKLEWILIDDSKESNQHLLPLHENILYIHLDSDFYLKDIHFKNDDKNITHNYFKKMKKLTNGFKRDYGVGMSSNEYILHLDIDTFYRPNTIQRKLDFLLRNKLECVYCDSMLCYDIFGKQMYKTEQKNGYESTLFHTKDFWRRSGFKWEDITNEALGFYFNKGVYRKMENYFDTVKLLGLHNLNQYHPVKVSLENMDIKIPEIINTIQTEHPIVYELYDLFYQKEIDVLSINSEMIDSLKNKEWTIQNLTYEKKEKEKKLIQRIQETNKNYQLCILNTKFPIWNIFEKIKFDCIIIESEKNREQMHSILEKNNYSLIHNLYFHHSFLE